MPESKNMTFSEIRENMTLEKIPNLQESGTYSIRMWSTGEFTWSLVGFLKKNEKRRYIILSWSLVGFFFLKNEKKEIYYIVMELSVFF